MQVKIDALKACILAMLNGEKFPRVMMTVIRFCINTESHELKKLITIFWEVRALGLEAKGLNAVCAPCTCAFSVRK